MRTQPERLNPETTLVKMLEILNHRPADPQHFKTNVLGKLPEYLTSADDLKLFKNAYDWHLMFINGKNSSELKFFLSCGNKQVYQLDGTRWTLLADLHITMPPKTLIYGEIVKEYSSNIYCKALHVIDAVMLGGIDISHLPLTERLNQCALFCAATHKPFEEAAVPLRCKRLFTMDGFSTAVEHLEYRAVKCIKKAVTIKVRDREQNTDRFQIVGSVLFIKQIKEPWGTAVSKKNGHKYYFVPGKPSQYNIPKDATLDMLRAFSSRVMWPWEPASAVLEGLPHEGLTRAQLEAYIQRNINR